MDQQQGEMDELEEILAARDARLVRPAWAPIWSDTPSGRPQGCDSIHISQ